MGCRSAPYIAMRCLLALKHIMNEMDHFVIAYADDFSSADTLERAWASYNAFEGLLHDLKISEATEKAVPPTQMLVFLSTGIDAVTQTIFMIPERIIEIRRELESWRYKSWCTRNELESMIGKLQFCTNCVRAGRVFICRLLNQLRGMQRGKFYIVRDDTRKDLKWWWIFLRYFKSSYILWLEQFSIPGEVLQTDSSKLAMGAVCKKLYIHIPNMDEFN